MEAPCLTLVTTEVCKHCSGALKERVMSEQGEIFCCRGCEFVYHLIQGSGLGSYYSMSKSEERKIPKADLLSSYQYLKDQSFLEVFSQNGRFLFFVDGVECLACNWLFDNLSDLSPHILEAHYDHSNHSLRIEVDDDQNLITALTPILQLGYHLKPIQKSSDLEQLNQKKKRSELIRLAAAMLLMGNIGLLSFSEYFGLEGELLRYFHIVSALLFVLVPTYCSWPFYKTSFLMMKSGSLSLDVPISLSIIVGTTLSYKHFFEGSGSLYFDSIISFVFLILLIRYILNSIYSQVASQNLASFFLGESQACVLEDGKELYKHISSLKVGDEVLVKAGTLNSVKGYIKRGSSYFNESLITGESHPVHKIKGSELHIGSYNYSQDVIVEITDSHQENPLEKFIKLVESRAVAFSNFSILTRNYSFFLLAGYLLVSIGLLYFFSFEQAFERILALSIIGCPCALGIGIPLAGILGNRALFKKGIIVKDPNFFEKLKLVDHIYLDKTGTLTTGYFEVKNVRGDMDFLPILVSLERKSLHPIAKSICAHWRDVKTVEVHNYREIPGEGILGEVSGETYRIGSNSQGGISLYLKEREIISLTLSEQLRPASQYILNKMSEKHTITVLSGDSEANVEKFAKILENKKIRYLGSLKPDEKLSKIPIKSSLFVGDGLNDIPGMSQASLSISFNASDIVNKACQCVFIKPDLNHILLLFKITDDISRIVVKNIYFSAFYNVVGAIAAMMGYISPLVAAIFMPLSSISIVLMTLYRGRRI